MEEYLGRGKYERGRDEDDKNYRNGSSNKTVRSSYGDVELDIPRDRNGDFNLVSVKKYKKDCNDLSNRGVRDILVACMDGLRGLPEAIKAVFQNVCIQNCIVHQIRNSIKYVSYKDKKEFMKDIKLVYTEEIALSQLDIAKEKWDYRYASVVDSWY